MAKQVLGVGHACLDQVLIWQDSKLPIQDNKLVQYDVQGGGMVATALFAVARLGGEAEFWGVVGDDPLGGLILNELEQEGVNIDHVLKVAGKEGPVAIVCVDAETGGRCFFSGKPVPDPLEPFGDLGRVADCGCVLLDGRRLVAARPAAKRAHELGIPVVGDLSFVMESNAEMIRLFDYAIASDEYFERIGFGNDLDAACKSLCDQGAKVSVVTCGSKGLIYYDGSTLEHLEAFKISVVDTTGAGDTFHGAFCFGLMRGLELRDNLIFSSAVSALKCGKIGGRAGIPHLEEVAVFLRDNGKSIKGIT